jgi:hypothetical protein
MPETMPATAPRRPQAAAVAFLPGRLAQEPLKERVGRGVAMGTLTLA